MAKTKQGSVQSGSINLNSSTGFGLGDSVKQSSTGLGLGGNIDVIEENKPICLVYPYLKDRAQGEELLYSIRSAEKNFKAHFKVVIIGDSEPWFGEEILHIPADVVSTNPQVDTLNKLKMAVADERISDSFIWMNDDIYFNTPVLLCDIQILTAQGVLKEMKDSKSLYDQNRNRTIELLQSNDLLTLNYDTHTPFFYEKDKLVSLFIQFPELEDGEGYLIPSIYNNFYYRLKYPMQFDGVTGHYQLRINSKNTNQSDFDKYIVGKKFLNNAEAGYNKVLVDYLEKHFGEPCKIEK